MVLTVWTAIQSCHSCSSSWRARRGQPRSRCPAHNCSRTAWHWFLPVHPSISPTAPENYQRMFRWISPECSSGSWAESVSCESSILCLKAARVTAINSMLLPSHSLMITYRCWLWGHCPGSCAGVCRRKSCRCASSMREFAADRPGPARRTRGRTAPRFWSGSRTGHGR